MTSKELSYLGIGIGIGTAAAMLLAPRSGEETQQLLKDKANDAKRLKELEGENARLKKLLAEAELDKAMLKELAEGNF